MLTMKEKQQKVEQKRKMNRWEKKTTKEKTQKK